MSINSTVYSFLSGALGGGLATILLQPFDVLRTRYQMNATDGFLSQFGSIVKKNEKQLTFSNIPKLWSGVVPSLARCVPGIGAYFALITATDPYLNKYTHFNNYIIEPLMKSYPFSQGLACRSLISFALNPITVVKTRSEFSLSNKRIRPTIWEIYRFENGFRGLYRGTVSSIMRDSPYSGLFLFAYSQLKNHNEGQQMRLPQPVTSFLAASFATLATQPYDVLRTYRQLNLFKTDFPTTALCKHIYKTHGPLGFLRGFNLRLIKRSLFSVITWYTYEAFK